ARIEAVMGGLPRPQEARRTGLWPARYGPASANRPQAGDRRATHFGHCYVISETHPLSSDRGSLPTDGSAADIGTARRNRDWRIYLASGDPISSDRDRGAEDRGGVKRSVGVGGRRLKRVE